MTESFNGRFGFLSNTDTADDDSRKIETVTRTLKKLDKSFESTITNLTKVLNKTTDESLRKNINKLLDTAKKQENIRKRLRTSGEVITRQEADNLLKASKALREGVQGNQELLNAVKKAGSGSFAEIDPVKELEKASKEIGESAGQFFVTNAKDISQTGLAGDASSTALRAISPEVAFFTEALGINLQEQTAGLFDHISDSLKDEEKIVEGEVDADEVEAREDQLIQNTAETEDAVESLSDNLTDFFSDQLTALSEISETLHGIRESGDQQGLNLSRLDQFLAASNLAVADMIDSEDADIDGPIIIEREIGEIERQEEVQANVDAELDDLLGESVDNQEELDDLLETTANDTQEIEDTLDDLLGEVQASNEETDQPLIDAIERIEDSTAAQTEAVVEAINEQTLAQTEQIDDVEDAINDNGPGLFSRFFGRGSFLGKLLSPLGRIVGFLSPLGKLLGKIGLGGLAKGGIGGLGALLGFDALKDIQGEGLTTGNALQSVASGAGIGFMLGGPLGALIGGGVGGFAALIADAIEPEHIEMIQNGFRAAADTVFGAFDKAVDWVSARIQAVTPVIMGITDAIGNFLADPIGTIDSAFDSLGMMINDAVFATMQKATEIKDGIVNWGSGVIDSITESIDSVGESISNGLERMSNFFTDSFNSIKDAVLNPIDTLFGSDDEDKKETLAAVTPVTLTNAEKEQIGEFIDSTVDSLGNFIERVKTFVDENELDLGTLIEPLIVQMDTGSTQIETSEGIENDMAQAQVAQSIKEGAQIQANAVKEQGKITVKAVEENGKQPERLQGQRTLDNSPVHSNDIGLVMVLGGGG